MNAFEIKIGHSIISKLIFGALPMRPGESEEIKADISLILKKGWSPSINHKDFSFELLNKQ